ncbi:AAA family ATPase [Qaidamihabitans albus]|uniref:AAA family ATPase n=1 Tax=Qaidamihabitans albus TaxID=2795733 RepID=UPI0018F1E703|nr:AAA family ATPase [Qaidamihabitans albus]
MDIAGRDRLQVRIEHRALLVVAGLPGAGKSTLLRNVVATAPITVLDTDQIRARLRALFPPGMPYAWYRPLVHLLQTLRLVLTAVRATGPLVVHDPATGGATRAAFVALGMLTGRTRHLLWIDCTVAEALAGQHQRGRVLLGWSFSRHARNAPRIRDRLLTGKAPRGWAAATATGRADARHGLRIVVAAPGGVPGGGRHPAVHRSERR